MLSNIDIIEDDMFNNSFIKVSTDDLNTIKSYFTYIMKAEGFDIKLAYVDCNKNLIIKKEFYDESSCFEFFVDDENIEDMNCINNCDLVLVNKPINELATKAKSESQHSNDLKDIIKNMELLTKKRNEDSEATLEYKKFKLNDKVYSIELTLEDFKDIFFNVFSDENRQTLVNKFGKEESNIISENKEEYLQYEDKFFFVAFDQKMSTVKSALFYRYVKTIVDVEFV